MRGLGTVMAASLLTTEGLLLLEGRWQEAIPLHLCSVSAIAAFLLALRRSRFALDFLWYLGMPGALLALLFPAPAVSRHQLLLNLSYVATHALILIIPACRIASGMRVRRGRVKQMLLVIHALALLAYAVNRLLGTDFLFLMAPPAGTPLSTAFDWGYGWYLLALEALVCALLLITSRLLPALCPSVME